MMCKVISGILFFLVLCLPAYPQNRIPKPDSLRIENLKNKLPRLKGRALVDCLNEISREYQNLNTYQYSNTPQNQRSTYYYARLAQKEALKINYQYGLAFALMEIGYQMLLTPLAINYLQKAISIGESLHNDKILGWAYLKLSFKYALSNAYKFDRSKTTALAEKALKYFEKAGDNDGEMQAAHYLCQNCRITENHEMALPYCDKALLYSKKRGTRNLYWSDFRYMESLLAISRLYEAVGDYKTAMDYLLAGQQYGIKHQMGWQMEEEMGQLFDKLGEHDSAFYYLKKGLDSAPNFFYSKLWLSENYIATGQFSKAMDLFRECEDQVKWQTSYGRSLLRLNTGLAWEGQGNYDSALTYAKKVLPSVIEPHRILDRLGLLSRTFHELGKNDSAYFYQMQYATLKDSVSNRQLLWRLNEKLYRYKKAAEDQKKAANLALLQKDILLKGQLIKEQVLLKEQKEAEIALLDKDNKLKQQQLEQEVFLKEQKEDRIAILDKDNRIKQQKLKQETMIRYFLFACLFAFILTGYFIFHNLSLKRKNEKLGRARMENELKLQKLESDKKNAELQQQATELEMQALRAQMNPHFIFNCLSSINKYIIKNETESASDYLTRFSRLIRMVLINSQKSLITLEDELDMLRLYLDMERLRFNNAFDYNINFMNTIEPAAIFIPPLLLQPFCENAIWHGLMHKKGHGKLDIALRLQGNILGCTITDNGVGREKAIELKSKSAERQKSFGLNITNHRLALINQGTEVDSNYEMNDIVNDKGETDGTQVDIRIRYKNLLEDVTS